jgi:hypothetical protein
MERVREAEEDREGEMERVREAEEDRERKVEREESIALLKKTRASTFDSSKR